MANIKLFQKYFFPRARRALYEIRQIPHIPQKKASAGTMTWYGEPSKNTPSRKILNIPATFLRWG
jgi:hypothetical protein